MQGFDSVYKIDLLFLILGCLILFMQKFIWEGRHFISDTHGSSCLQSIAEPAVSEVRVDVQGQGHHI